MLPRLRMNYSHLLCALRACSQVGCGAAARSQPSLSARSSSQRRPFRVSCSQGIPAGQLFGLSLSCIWAFPDEGTREIDCPPPPPPSLLPSPGWPYGQRYQTGGKTLLWYHALERVGTINPPEPGCLDHFIYQGPFPLSLWFSSTITHISPYSAFSSASQTLTALSILLPLR